MSPPADLPCLPRSELEALVVKLLSWTIRRGRKAPPPEGAQRQAAGEIAVPVFGYKNHIGIDRRHGFIRRFAVTHAARHDASQLAAVLDPANTASDVWADTAYRGQANLALLARRGLVAQLQRAKPRGKPMPAHITRGNATRARVRSRVEHVFAATKVRMGLLVRTIGLARATVKITLANLAYNLTRFAWFERRTALAREGTRTFHAARHPQRRWCARDIHAQTHRSTSIFQQNRLFEVSNCAGCSN